MSVREARSGVRAVSRTLSVSRDGTPAARARLQSLPAQTAPTHAPENQREKDRVSQACRRSPSRCEQSNSAADRAEARHFILAKPHPGPFTGVNKVRHPVPPRGGRGAHEDAVGTAPSAAGMRALHHCPVSLSRSEQIVYFGLAPLQAVTSAVTPRVTNSSGNVTD